jgi:superfamily II DNA or RNA helicase
MMFICYLLPIGTEHMNKELRVSGRTDSFKLTKLGGRFKMQGDLELAPTPPFPDNWKDVGRWIRESGIQGVLLEPAATVANWIRTDDYRSYELRLRLMDERGPANTVGHLLKQVQKKKPNWAHGARDALRACLIYRAGRQELVLQRATTWKRPISSVPLQRLAEAIRSRLTRLSHDPATAEPSFQAAHRKLTLTSDPPGVTGGFAGRYRFVNTTHVSFARLDHGEIESSCDCYRGHVGCVHQRILLEALLDVIHGPEANKLRRHLDQIVSIPAWTRFVAALQTQLNASKPARQTSPRKRLVWRIGLDDSGCVSITPAIAKRLASGKWSSGAKASWQDLRYKAGEFADDVDRHIMGAMTLGKHVKPPPLIRVLDALDGCSRVFLEVTPSQRCRVQRGRATLAAVPRADGVVLAVRVGDESLTPQAALKARVGDSHLAVLSSEGGTCDFCEIDAWAMTLVELAARYSAILPPESYSVVLPALSRVGTGVDLDLPDSVAGQKQPADSRPLLRLSPLDDDGETGAEGLDASLWVRPVGASGPLFAPGQGARIVFTAQGTGYGSFSRDLSREKQEATELATRLGLPQGLTSSGEWRWQIQDLQEALDLLWAIREKAPDTVVEWPEKRKNWQVSGTGQVNLRLQKQRDWFGLEGEADVDGEKVPLALLMQSLRQGKRYVRLGPGRFARIADELQSRLLATDEVVTESKRGLVVGRTAAVQLPALWSEPGELEGDRSWLELCSRLHQAEQLEPSVPAQLQATLRPYQVDGFKWLARLSAWDAGACLADDMGLGKTIQTLAVLLDRAPRGPALVVAPTSVGFNWVAEAERFAPTLDVKLYRGPRRREGLGQLGPGVVLVTSYDLLALDEEALSAVDFATLVLDEAQAIKNPATKRARAARSIKAAFRLALTGTPVENHLSDLWSLFRVVLPGLLGTWDRFRRRFALPIERDNDDERRRILVRLIGPFLLRRTKALVAPELPPRTETIRTIELSRAERGLYEAARREAIDQLITGDKTGQGDKIHLFAAMTRLRRLACHPRLFDEQSTVASAKLKVAVEILEDLLGQGGRALVFSQFTGHLQLLAEALAARGVTYQYLDGKTPAKKRGDLVARWIGEETSLFLISLKAGGTGLNLTGADMVVHLDPWWNPAVEDQATDRTHRIGQDRPVTVVRLITQQTIEEAVVALHREKRELAQSLLEGAERTAQLSQEELLALIRWGEGSQDEADDDELEVGEYSEESEHQSAPVGRAGGNSPDVDASATAGDEPLDVAGLSGVVEEFIDELTAERDRDRITRPTLNSYARMARELVLFAQVTADEQGAAPRSLEEWCDLYQEVVASPGFAGPASRRVQVPTVLRRLMNSAGAATEA